MSRLLISSSFWYLPCSFLHGRSSAVIVHTWLRGVIGEAVIIVVDLAASSLKYRDNVVKGAKTVGIN